MAKPRFRVRDKVFIKSKLRPGLSSVIQRIVYKDRRPFYILKGFTVWFGENELSLWNEHEALRASAMVGCEDQAVRSSRNTLLSAIAEVPLRVPDRNQEVHTPS